MTSQPMPATASVVHLTRRYWFSASHRLHNPSLPDADNLQIYGKCNNPGGHGHNYFLEVSVAGPVDPRTGMVINLADLDRRVEADIIERFHQGNLNEDGDFHQTVPTTENLCVEIYRIMSQGWSTLDPAGKASLERIRLEETGSNFFEYSGEAPAQQAPAL